MQKMVVSGQEHNGGVSQEEERRAEMSRRGSKLTESSTANTNEPSDSPTSTLSSGHVAVHVNNSVPASPGSEGGAIVETEQRNGYQQGRFQVEDKLLSQRQHGSTDVRSGHTVSLPESAEQGFHLNVPQQEYNNHVQVQVPSAVSGVQVVHKSLPSQRKISKKKGRFEIMEHVDIDGAVGVMSSEPGTGNKFVLNSAASVSLPSSGSSSPNASGSGLVGGDIDAQFLTQTQFLEKADVWRGKSEESTTASLPATEGVRHSDRSTSSENISRNPVNSRNVSPAPPIIISAAVVVDGSLDATGAEGVMSTTGAQPSEIDGSAVPVSNHVSVQNNVAPAAIIGPTVAGTSSMPPIVKKKGRFMVINSAPQSSANSETSQAGVSITAAVGLLPGEQGLTPVSVVALPPVHPSAVVDVNELPPSIAIEVPRSADEVSGSEHATIVTPSPAVLTVPATMPATVTVQAVPDVDTSVRPSDTTAGVAPVAPSKSSHLTEVRQGLSQFDARGGSGGFGKVLYFLDQMKIEVTEADKINRGLMQDIKFLKDKNKELEARSRDLEKRLAEEKALREHAEGKAKHFKKKLNELKRREATIGQTSNGESGHLGKLDHNEKLDRRSPIRSVSNEHGAGESSGVGNGSTTVCSRVEANDVDKLRCPDVPAVVSTSPKPTPSFSNLSVISAPDMVPDVKRSLAEGMNSTRRSIVDPIPFCRSESLPHGGSSEDVTVSRTGKTGRVRPPLPKLTKQRSESEPRVLSLAKEQLSQKEIPLQETKSSAFEATKARPGSVHVNQIDMNNSSKIRCSPLSASNSFAGGNQRANVSKPYSNSAVVSSSGRPQRQPNANDFDPLCFTQADGGERAEVVGNDHIGISRRPLHESNESVSSDAPFRPVDRTHDCIVVDPKEFVQPYAAASHVTQQSQQLHYRQLNPPPHSPNKTVPGLSSNGITSAVATGAEAVQTQHLQSWQCRDASAQLSMQMSHEVMGQGAVWQARENFSNCSFVQQQVLHQQHTGPVLQPGAHLNGYNHNKMDPFDELARTASQQCQHN